MARPSGAAAMRRPACAVVGAHRALTIAPLNVAPSRSRVRGERSTPCEGVPLAGRVRPARGFRLGRLASRIWPEPPCGQQQCDSLGRPFWPRTRAPRSSQREIESKPCVRNAPRCPSLGLGGEGAAPRTLRRVTQPARFATSYSARMASTSGVPVRAARARLRADATSAGARCKRHPGGQMRGAPRAVQRSRATTASAAIAARRAP